MEPVAALVLNSWKKQPCTPVPCSSLAKSLPSALDVTGRRGGWTSFQAKAIAQPADLLLAWGRTLLEPQSTCA